jgi:competence protein ComEC
MLAAAFLIGVILHDSATGIVVAVPLLVGGAIAAYLVGRRGDRTLIVLALIAIAFGAWRAQAGATPTGLVTATLTNPDRSIDATIVGIPRSETTRTTASIRLQGARKQQLDVSLPLYPSVNSGDHIRFWAPQTWDTETPGLVELPLAPGESDLFIPAFEIERSSTSTIDRFRMRFNDFLTISIEQHVPEPAGALTLGILNGDDTGMTDTTRSAFRSAGMSHITAVSGWNVALVAGLIAIFTGRFSPSRVATMLSGVSVVWAYAFLVGMSPSVVRAAGMATVFLIARWRGRPGDLLTSILITVALIVAITPVIRFDIGFQLSVVATLGIILFFEQASTWTTWQSSLALPFVAEIAVAPLILHHFGMYSILSPLANVVTAPLVEVVMAGGVATAIMSLVHPTLADIAGTATWVPARLIIAVAERTASLGTASDKTVTLSWTGTFVTYLSLLSAYVIWSQWRAIQRLKPRTRQVEEGI